jgi:PAS domain S-box-containing protein
MVTQICVRSRVRAAGAVMELSDYSLEPLRTDGEFLLYRGRHARPTQASEPSVLVLTTVLEHPKPASIRRLEHEFSLRDELDPAWAARPLTLGSHQGRPMLVLTDPGGEPLERLLERRLELTECLRLAVGLAAALGQLHGRGLIHKDLKPAHLLVHSATGQVWLTGFGIASPLPRERQAPEPPEVIAGTLPYMAPEQTGRMNRSIDARSDLYSLGVTLYEMLTGTLPFAADDPMEWVHCHIARRPVPPAERRPEVPGVVSAMVMKLLAKTAEERYQTAAGLEGDLRRCLAQWEAERRIDDFPLGEHDTPDRLRIPEKLYGREREIETLLAAFERAVQGGAPELVLVSGYSGIGKSAVVNELHKVLVPPRGLFAAGKFDQYQRDIPYATLAQAFRSLIRPLLGKNEAELGRWRDALGDALGLNGRLMVDLVPELKLILGEPPPVPELPPQQAQGRFQLVFRRFIGVFARSEHPLALFLDDLQWLDAATLDLLEHLVTHSEVRHLLLVGAYRDNEVGPTHPLTRTLAAIRAAGARVQEMVLAPLGLDDVDRLVADSLRCEPERARPLAQLVQEKTGGNPFFAIQFFTALAEEGLLAFDSVVPAWQWDIERVRAKSYTDNVVEFMAGKLQRFSATTQEALKQLACLGNVAEMDTLALVHGETEEKIHAALWEAVHAGLVFRLESAYQFLHDRIQQAAYSLIPEEHRAGVHLRIGRVLLASMTADQLAEHLFDVANQLNRGAARLTERDEKAQVATIDLRAGRKAKASAAYASARAYFAAGMALLDESDWGSHHELTFSLWLERAECEILSGNFENADQLIVELLQRAASNVEFAHASCLKIDLHAVKGEHPQAVDSALTCLRLFGIDLPAHPTPEQLQAEYETVWQTLDGRPIESLIDLPPMRDPELQAVMQVLSFLVAPAYFTDRNLWCLQTCRMVSVSMQHGTSGASAYAYGLFGMILGRTFHRYREGYRLGRFACDLVEKYGFISSQAKVYSSMGIVAFWTQPIATAIDFMRACFRTAIETGDQTFACYGLFHFVTGLLLRNDPLDAVRRESEMALDFVRKTRYGDVADMIANQQRFIATMQGRSATFSTFSDAQFDEAAFEAQLIGDRMPMMICYYWIGKLKARFLSGDYAEALAAADKAKAMLWGAFDQIVMVDYYCYTALTVAALFENASADDQAGWRALLTAHQEQLREWADTNPPTFGDKHALVAAEIARLEGRDPEAMCLYEQAIQSAREHGFVQNEGLASELAGRCYLDRGLEMNGYAHLRNAHTCYALWGADGKVRQLERLYPRLAATGDHLPQASAGSSVQQVDVATVVKASHALSSEIVLPTLIETLMTFALQNAGADRGLLILPRADGYSIEAEAGASGDKVEVILQEASITGSSSPEALLRYVIRTKQSVILDDVSRPHLFSEDDYWRRSQAKSVLCLPLVKQGMLAGLLYLENTLTSHVFTPGRIAVLELLAAQAAISLENARLYSDLREQAAKIRRLVDANIIGIMISDLESGIIDANDAFLEMAGYTREDLVAGRLRWKAMTPPEWQPVTERALAQLRATGHCEPYEKEYWRKDGSRVPVLVGAAAFEGRRQEGVAFVLDLTERKQAEEARRLAEQARQTAVLEERNRMAREIHDGLGQVFTGILLQMGALELLLGDRPAQEQALLKSVRDLAQMGLIEARRSAHALRPQVLEETDLAGAFERMTTQLNAAQTTRITFRRDGAPRPLRPDVADHLLRIGQEVLTNALRHAQASEICVELSFAGEELRLCVSDDGRGFATDTQLRKEGFGLTGIQERADIIGALLAVVSQPGAGTRVELTWRFPPG